MKFLLKGCYGITQRGCNAVHLGLCIVALQIGISISLGIGQRFVYSCCNAFKAYCILPYLQKLYGVRLLVAFYTESIVLQLETLPCIIYIH